MPLELQTALISALIALLTAGVSGYFTWSQVQREKNKWLMDLKTSYSVELHKTRLISYPEIFQLLGQLSMHASDPLTPAKAQQIGQAIHAWLYSSGGLCAEASTRGALKGLRHYCLEWKQGARPPELAQWRHTVLFLLRRDLDLQGFESFDPRDSGPLLKKLQAEMSLMQ
ncbi:hypothetical protein [Ktedonospora formicarum]|uniref:DUF4760 domain-containing protein n=1 Tax=Ktedonospora formicarum TaxID=2778364 RepID=A0A8J3MW55_9CHLR|nr:hypothetical protein [Ktedonospora formicarum]GHO51087.1 hypothetical protein KSX_92500 [Ktedonospora formicarum]